MRMLLNPLRVALACGLVFGLVRAADQPASKAQTKPSNVFTDPAEAGPDFKLQGEYEGEVAGKGKVGAQVVALGDGRFDVYFLAGGLPGAGWDTRTRVKATSQTNAGKTTVSSNEWNGEIVDGQLTGKTEDSSFTLKHMVRQSPTLGARPPEGALVLFDGSNADAWAGGKLVEGNLLRWGCRSKQPFGQGKLHIEFRTPFQPKARGQGRGNSGVFILGHEMQVLDSFGLTGANNECGAFYGKAKPAVNMCFPPLSWQTYDMEVKSGDKDTFLATVFHNGVKVHDNYAIKSSSFGGSPILLQDHGNPVVYRNIWIVETK
jgi:hypothetical protein